MYKVRPGQIRRRHNARGMHAQSACTYTELKLKQLCLLTASGLGKSPSFDQSIIRSTDIIGHMLFCCHSNYLLMLQMIMDSDTDLRDRFRHKKYLATAQVLQIRRKSQNCILKAGYFNPSKHSSNCIYTLFKSDTSFHRVLTITPFQI